MATILRFLKNSGIFMIGSVLSKALAFLMLPLYTSVIAPHDMGYYDLSLVYLTIVCEALFLDIWVVILRYMYDYPKNKRGKAIAAGLTLFAISTLFYVVLAITVGILFDIKYFWLIASFGLIQNISYVYKFVTRGYGKNLDFAISGILSAIVIVSTNLTFLLGFKWDFSALYISAMLGLLTEILYLEIRVRVVSQLRWKDFSIVSRAYLWEMVKYATPIGLSAVTYWFLFSFNRIIVGQLLSLDDAGIFAVAMRFGSLITLVSTAFTLAWQDIAFSREDKNGSFFGKASSFYLAGLLIMLGVFLPLILLLFDMFVGSAYAAALPLIPLALAVATFSGFSNFVVNIFYSIKSSKVPMYSMVAAAVTSVSLSLTLVPYWKVQGANFATTVAYIVNIIIMIVALTRMIQLKLAWPPILIGFSVAGASALVFFQLGKLGNFLWLMALLVAGLVVFHRLIRPELKQREV